MEPESPLPSKTPLAERLRGYFVALRAKVAAANGNPLMPGILILRVWNFIGWTERRLQHALRHAAAGTSPRPSRLRAPRPSPRPVPPDNPCRPRTPRLPMRECWLIPLMPNQIAVHGSLLRALLTDPDFSPLLAIPSVVRALRPLCRMLGVSAALPPQSPTPTPPRPPCGTPRPDRPRRGPAPGPRIPAASFAPPKPPKPPQHQTPPAIRQNPGTDRRGIPAFIMLR